MNGSAPVVVLVEATGVGDGGPRAGDGAVHWAAREAARAGRPLRVLLPPGGGPRRRQAALAHALAVARRAAPGLAVTPELGDRPAADAARIAAAVAALLVVTGGGDRGTTPVDGLVVTSPCPLVVVPRGPVGPDPTGPVLLAAAPATPADVVEFAFAFARAHGTDVLAVRTWHDPMVDLGLLTGDRIARWDAADEAVRADLADQLSLARLAHPDVAVSTRVVDDGCAELLATLATRSSLLVLGRPARGAALGRLLPSPALTLARLAPCPVAVVPPEGPARRALLPQRRIGLSDLRG